MIIWSRDESGWRSDAVSGPEAGLALPAIGVVLMLDEVYDGVTFPAKPRIVLQ